MTGIEDDATRGLTRRLVEQALAVRWQSVPASVQELARQCLLDWVAVTLGGAHDSLVNIVFEVTRAEAGVGQATILGRALRLAPTQAALVNGTASHALDYDDVNYAMSGHPSVPLFPALFALAEAMDASGEALLTAFIAGYEFECRVGAGLAPGHYARGFHATATIGALGAAMACAHLRGLDATRTAHALGIAATQAAGLKSLFGTDCKPLHAGNAARTGLLASELAARGFTARDDVIECAQGFAATHADAINVEAVFRAPPGGFHILSNLFKYHASCYETHATIEACRKLRGEIPADATRVRTVEVRVNPYCDRICNLQAPTDGLQAKFSLRQMAAFSLQGLDTADARVFSRETIESPAIRAWWTRVAVVLDAAIKPSQAKVQVLTHEGRHHEAFHDAAKPEEDLFAQRARLANKMAGLLGAQVDGTRLRALQEACLSVEHPGGFAALMPLIGPTG